MTRVAVLQSNYIPWRGYFDLMDDVDVFIVYDDVQYTKSDWRNRNKIKTPAGSKWITVPVRRTGLGTLIENAEIDDTRDWPTDHLNAIEAGYRKAPFHRDVMEWFAPLLTAPATRLSELNVRLLRAICAHLGIVTHIRTSRDLDAIGDRTQRLVALVEAVGGSTYVSGPAAKDYIDASVFHRAGIRLEYKSYDYAPYPQLWGAFDGAVSVLDLLFNTGPEARRHLESRSPNEVVTPS